MLLYALRSRSVLLNCCKKSVFLLASIVATVRADVIHMRDGEKIEAEILATNEDTLRIRTPIGTIDVDKDQILRIEKKPSPWRRYAARREACADTAEAHFQFAEWCRRQGLSTERQAELREAVLLDPDHESARKSLGFVIGDDGAWVKKTVIDRPTPEQREAARAQRDEEKFIRSLITEWFLKTGAIYRARMAGNTNPNSSEFRTARKQLLAIRDPLALPALTGVLSAGHVAARTVLVEVLSRFRGDEATMNLLVMTLLDPSASVRRLASEALAPRNDDRVVARLRDALGSDEETILRRAARALGTLKARSAVGDLVAVLSTEDRRTVRISRPVFIGGIRSTFGGHRRVVHGARVLHYQPTSIGVLGSGTMIGTVSDIEVRTMTNFRTEVQEALISISGRNFGFDRAAWLDWWRGRMPIQP